MAIRLKDIGSLAKKFVTRAGAAGGDYKDGVAGAGADWEARTRASEDAYKQGVTMAANEGRFGKGVSEAGSAKYVQRATTLGAQRYPTGVGAAEGDWAKGFAPYHQALQSLDLPPRGPRGTPQNQQISNAVAVRLAAIKRGK